jgi:curved DNA-binding protein CbpA
MENYYSILGLSVAAAPGEIKKAFREMAKKLHPDTGGKDSSVEAMRRLLAAYQVLSDPYRRSEYDRAYRRFVKPQGFDYRDFLRERGDPESQAKLIFFLLLHLEEEEAISIWDRQGGLDFPMHRCLDREDWMDCCFILAEELAARGRCYEAFRLLTALVREERRRPYFRLFMEEVETALRELVRLRLKGAVNDVLLINCLEELLGLGFQKKEEARWLMAMAEAFFRLGDSAGAAEALKAAAERDPRLPNLAKLRRKTGNYVSAGQGK